MAQFSQSLSLYLADAFPCDTEDFADFFKRSGTIIVQTKAKAEEPKAEDIQIISGVKLAVDDAHETDRTNSSITFDRTSEWASTHRNCYGLQKTHFSDLTVLPESVDLVYGDQRVTVKLSQTE